MSIRTMVRWFLDDITLRNADRHLNRIHRALGEDVVLVVARADVATITDVDAPSTVDWRIVPEPRARSRANKGSDTPTPRPSDPGGSQRTWLHAIPDTNYRPWTISTEIPPARVPAAFNRALALAAERIRENLIPRELGPYALDARRRAAAHPFDDVLHGRPRPSGTEAAKIAAEIMDEARGLVTVPMDALDQVKLRQIRTFSINGQDVENLATSILNTPNADGSTL